MPKRRLTHRQANRIKYRQQQAGSDTPTPNDDDSLGPEQHGLVIAHYGVSVEVEAQSGEIVRCALRQHLGVLVPGDQVIWRASTHTIGVVVACQPRRTVLGRPDASGDIKPVAANIDTIFITFAPTPAYSLLIIDSYLVAAELLQISPCLILNKIDLISKQQRPEIDNLTTLYQGLGYTLIQLSCETGENVKALQQAVQQHTHIIVGQSGVGKSSLIQQLLPASEVRTGAISTQSQLGTHTTTTARLYHLPQGGALIDSPGIRSFALWRMTPAEIAKGFVEFKPFIDQCKFRDCLHQKEPGCALRQALKDGLIARSRFENFQKLLMTAG